MDDRFRDTAAWDAPEPVWKHIALYFKVPLDLDLPSETLAQMKALLLAGLQEYMARHPDLSEGDKALGTAMLMG